MASSETWRLDAEPAVWGRAGEYTGRAAEYEERMPSGTLCVWVIPLLLSVAGILMIASLTSAGSRADDMSLYRQAFRQFKFLGLGIASMCVCCVMPLSFMRRMSRYLWLLALLLCCLTRIPGLGVMANGARRWLNLFGFQFQPVEILTLAVPMFLADRLSATKREEARCFCKPTLVIAVISAIPISSHMGGLILVFAICMSMHVLSRGWKYPLMGAVVLSMLLLFMIYLESYRQDRLFAFLDPWSDPKDGGYQIIQGLIAFSNGGLMGVGLGKGQQKLRYLPEAHTDYIFPAIGEEFGLVGTLIIVLLYAFWAYKAYMLYRRSRSPYLSVLIWGITASVLCPMFVNLGGVMKLIPLTGVPLPFLSYGGTSLVMMWVKIGVLMRAGKELSLRSGAEAGTYYYGRTF